MDPQELQRLNDRIAKLESFNRRLRSAVVLMVFVFASALWMGVQAKQPQGQQPPQPQVQQKPQVPPANPAQTPPAKPKPAPRRKPTTPPPPPAPSVIEASQLVLKNPAGQVVATLGMTAGGGPSLRFVGPNTKERAVLGLDNAGDPRFIMMTADGNPSVAVTVGPDGMPAVELLGPTQTKVRLAIAADGPGFHMVDAQGLDRMAIDLKAEGPALILTDKNKVPRATFNTIETGPNLLLFDASGRSRMMLSVRPNQSAIALQDSKGDVRAGLEVRGDNPAFALYNANGKAIFEKQ